MWITWKDRDGHRFSCNSRNFTYFGPEAYETAIKFSFGQNSWVMCLCQSFASRDREYERILEHLRMHRPPAVLELKTDG